MTLQGNASRTLPITRNTLPLSINRVMLVSVMSLSLLACSSPVTHQSLSLSRVERLMEQMTLAEKVQLLHGVENRHSGAGTIQGIPRLGIPSVSLTDGPAGIRNAHYTATAMPAPIALAASFDPHLAYQYGRVLGTEARMQQQDVVLAPMANLVRAPLAGRNFETLGEDPVLTGRLVTQEIKGIQDVGTLATVKHFVVNNQETQRMTVTTNVDEQALHELYLPPFKQAIKQGHVASVMCAYNRVAINGHRGQYACAHSALLTRILRQDWGFDGFVMSDWYAAIPGVFTEHATPSPTPIMAGLDVEMPGSQMLGSALLKAVKSGAIRQSYVDRSVYRLLTQMDRFGLLDGTQNRVLPTVNEPKSHRDTAEQVALKGAVLLQNAEQRLPLKAGDMSNLLVVGPTAASLNYGGGGSSRVKPNETVMTPLAALRHYAGANAHIRYLPGINLDGQVVPGPALMPAMFSAEKGLLRHDSQGQTIIDPIIDYVGQHGLTAKKTVTWDGVLVAPENGNYTIQLQTRNGVAKLSFDGGRSYALDTASLFNAHNSVILTRDGLENAFVTITLKAGQKQRIHIEALSGQVGAFSSYIAKPDAPMSLRLAWQTPRQKQQAVALAVAAAKTAQAVVVFGFNEGTEGVDRTSLALPYHQDTLISQLAQANQHVTVVLNTGDAVTMPWMKQVDAILQMWYPGQYGGDATAKLLLGRANPSGRLPVSFPESAQETWLSSAQRFPGVNGQVYYDEGLFFGYRWFDKNDERPLFPFGYGLSYTQFRYRNPKVVVKDKQFTVRFTVINTGQRAGTDVPQLYLGAPANARVPVPVKKLVSFQRVALKPGKSAQVTLTLNLDAFKFWDSNVHQWRILPGKRPLYLGHSAEEVEKIAVLNPGIGH